MARPDSDDDEEAIEDIEDEDEDAEVGAPPGDKSASKAKVLTLRDKTEFISSKLQTNQKASIRQTAWDAFEFQGPDQKKGGDRIQGWADLSDDRNVGVTAFLKDAWQQFPAGLEADGDGNLIVWLARETLNLGNTVYGGGDALGVAKSHEIILRFHGKEWTPEKAQSRATDFQHPLMPTSTPDWLCASDVVGPLHPYDPKNFPDDEKAMANLMNGMIRQHSAYSTLFGIFDYGGTHNSWDNKAKMWSRKKRFRTNNETTGDSTMYSVWMQYARTLKRDAFEWCAARTRHLMDVDMTHYNPAQKDNLQIYISGYTNIPGFQHTHQRDHWNGYSQPHHTLYDDIALYYEMTGDRRAMDVMKLGAWAIRHAQLPQIYYEGASARQMSVPARIALDLYLKFFDPALLSYARDCWERVFTYRDGGPSYFIYGHEKYMRHTNDQRFLTEYFSQRLIDERNPPQEDLLTLQRRRRHLPWAWDEFLYMPQCAMNYFWTGDLAAIAVAATDGSASGGWYGVGLNLETFPDDNPDSKWPAASDKYVRGAYGPWNSGAVGYPQNTMACFKHAFLMHAFAVSKIRETNKIVPAVVATNGKGGGKWSDPKSWQAGQVPKPGEMGKVLSDDQVIFDKKSGECAGIEVSAKAVFLFRRGTRALTVKGNIVVKKDGLLKMGAGHTLLVHSRDDMPHNITVEGRFEAEGSSPKKPDCVLGSAIEHPYCKPKLTFQGRNRDCGSLRNCTVKWFGRIEMKDNYLPVIEGCRFIGGQTIDSSDGHIVYQHSSNRESPAPLMFTNNDIEGMTLSLTNVNNLRIEGNKFHDGTRALVYNSLGLPNQPNQIVNNEFFNFVQQENQSHGSAVIAISARDVPPVMKGNTYHHNWFGAISVNPGKVTLENETFYDNAAAIRVQGEAELSLINCILGKDRKGRERPNVDADISVLKGSKTRITLRDCVFASPTTVSGLKEAPGTSVRSENHNRVKGQNKTWKP